MRFFALTPSVARVATKLPATGYLRQVAWHSLHGTPTADFVLTVEGMLGVEVNPFGQPVPNVKPELLLESG